MTVWLMYDTTNTSVYFPIFSAYFIHLVKLFMLIDRSFKTRRHEQARTKLQIWDFDTFDVLMSL